MKHQTLFALALITIAWAAAPAPEARGDTTGTHLVPPMVGLVPPEAHLNLVGLQLMMVAPGDCILEDGSFASSDGGCMDQVTGIVWSAQSAQFGILSTWEEAKLYCDNLVEGGYDDWFLPSRNELIEVHANGSSTHMNLMNNINWSTTPKGKWKAYAVNLVGNGDVVVDFKASTRNCICIREPGQPPAPGIEVDSISPVSMAAGSSISITVTGAEFAPGANVTFEDGSGPAPQASDVVVAPDGLSLTADVSAGGGGKPGTRIWDVRVTNADGSTGIIAGGFAVIK